MYKTKLHFCISQWLIWSIVDDYDSNVKTRTLPAASVAGSEMKTAGLEEFQAEKYEAKEYYGNSIYFIPPKVSVQEVQYGLKAEEALERAYPPPVDPLDLFTNVLSMDFMPESLWDPEKPTEDLVQEPQAPAEQGTAISDESFPDNKTSSAVPDQVFSLKTIEDLKKGKFNTIWDMWQASKPGEEDSTKEVKKSYAEAAVTDLKQHQDFLATLPPQSLPNDVRIAQKLSLPCVGSFSPSTIERYREWRDAVQSSRTAADERLVVSLANDIGNSYINRYDSFQTTATDGNLKRKRDATPGAKTRDDATKVQEVVEVDEQDAKMPPLSRAPKPAPLPGTVGTKGSNDTGTLKRAYDDAWAARGLMSVSRSSEKLTYLALPAHTPISKGNKQKAKRERRRKADTKKGEITLQDKYRLFGRDTRLHWKLKLAGGVQDAKRPALSLTDNRENIIRDSHTGLCGGTKTNQQKTQNGSNKEKEVIQRPLPDDVLFGRGGHAKNHPGSQKFHALVKARAQEYYCLDRKGRKRMARELVQQLKNDGARFLQRDWSTGFYFEADDAASHRNASQWFLEEGFQHATRRERHVACRVSQSTREPS